MAEGHFYRDVLRAACEIPVVIVPPSSLDVATIGKLAPPPWGAIRSSQRWPHGRHWSIQPALDEDKDAVAAAPRTFQCGN
jgi:hypothetical protein